MTIEERASNVVRNVFHKEFWNDKVDADMRQIKNLMIEFATEQREIDIRFTVESHCNYCRSKHLCHIGTDGKYHVEGIICNDRELLEQAMKG